ncbi:hypothetical protein [Alcaligenes sp. 13f]|uniref:hypothetical protein n=1 Tax=Alcaligenes sp. 13f TaxID=2841924 RepID=UPI001CF6154C|nr:hypothetical protein [Alcaligenes sp. 13f]
MLTPHVGGLIRTTCVAKKLDGLGIAIPAADAPRALELGRAHLIKEAKIRADNQAGRSDPERFDATLRAKGLPV